MQRATTNNHQISRNAGCRGNARCDVFGSDRRVARDGWQPRGLCSAGRSCTHAEPDPGNRGTNGFVALGESKPRAVWKTPGSCASPPTARWTGLEARQTVVRFRKGIACRDGVLSVAVHHHAPCSEEVSLLLTNSNHAEGALLLGSSPWEGKRGALPYERYLSGRRRMIRPISSWLQIALALACAALLGCAHPGRWRKFRRGSKRSSKQKHGRLPFRRRSLGSVSESSPGTSRSVAPNWLERRYRRSPRVQHRLFLRRRKSPLGPLSLDQR